MKIFFKCQNAYLLVLEFMQLVCSLLLVSWKSLTNDLLAYGNDKCLYKYFNLQYIQYLKVDAARPAHSRNTPQSANAR